MDGLRTDADHRRDPGGAEALAAQAEDPAPDGRREGGHVPRASGPRPQPREPLPLEALPPTGEYRAGNAKFAAQLAE